MKFEREDYRAAQRKKWTLIIISGIALIGIFIIWNSYSQRSAADKELPNVTGEGTTTPAPQRNAKKKDLPTLVKDVKGAIAVIHTYDRKDQPVGQGTGFFINAQGHVVSNFHVFRGAHRAEVKLPSGTYPIYKVLGEDVDSDLILFSVKIKPGKYRFLSFVDKSPAVGERIVVIGNPLGLEATVSDGIVSAHRKVEPFGSVIQITSPISPGSSGSPVLNMFGEVIGVATFQYRQGQNLNFAIPIVIAKKLVSTGEKELADLSFADTDALASARGAFSRGRVYYDAGEYENAAFQFKEAVKEDPTNADAYYYLGMSYKAERPFDAVDAFKTAVSLDPDFTDAYCNLGEVYNQLEMYNYATQVLRQALRIKPDNFEALIQLGIAYASDKEYRAAVKVLERALDIEPDAQAYLYLGIACMATRDYDKALGSFQASLDQDPEFYEAYIGLGYCFAIFKNWKRGIISLRRAESLAPGHPEIHYLLGFMYLGDGDISAAEREARQLSKISRKWRGKKIAIYDERKLSEMLSELRTAITRHKNRRSRG
ncbi:MAG: tetratricopeptide repeat protein [Candidatus Aminicenantes bacterium]|nr:tetratricopeptide repeat protein [Candidatus Aminicenantes bacterium]